MFDSKHLTLGQLVWAARRDKNWTQEKLVTELSSTADVIITQSFLARLEHDEVRDPDPQILKAVARVLSLNYLDLLAPLLQKKYGVIPNAGTLTLEGLAAWITNTVQTDLYVATNSTELLSESRLLEAIVELLRTNKNSAITFFVPEKLRDVFKYFKARIRTQVTQAGEPLQGVILPNSVGMMIYPSFTIANTGLTKNSSFEVKPTGYIIPYSPEVAWCGKLSYLDTVSKLPALAELRQTALENV